MIADIASGHVELADVLFLVAFVLAVVAAVASLVRSVDFRVPSALGWGALGAAALAWLVL